MSDREAFIYAIESNPDIYATTVDRLVFADWLDEHGEHTFAEEIRHHANVILPQLKEVGERMARYAKAAAKVAKELCGVP